MLGCSACRQIACPDSSGFLSVPSLFWSTGPKLLRNTQVVIDKLCANSFRVLVMLGCSACRQIACPDSSGFLSVSSLFWSTGPKLLRNTQDVIDKLCANSFKELTMPGGIASLGKFASAPSLFWPPGPKLLRITQVVIDKLCANSFRVLVMLGCSACRQKFLSAPSLKKSTGLFLLRSGQSPSSP